jgi:hypothetical protein
VSLIAAPARLIGILSRNDDAPPKEFSLAVSSIVPEATMFSVVAAVIVATLPALLFRLLEEFRPREDAGAKRRSRKAVHGWKFWGGLFFAGLVAAFLMSYPVHRRDYVIHVMFEDGGEAPGGVRFRNDKERAAYTGSHGEIEPWDYPDVWLQESPPARLYGSYQSVSFETRITNDATGYRIVIPFSRAAFAKAVADAT